MEPDAGMVQEIPGAGLTGMTKRPRHSIAPGPRFDFLLLQGSIGA
jgi:hypothetical protein